MLSLRLIPGRHLRVPPGKSYGGRCYDSCILTDIRLSSPQHRILYTQRPGIKPRPAIFNANKTPTFASGNTSASPPALAMSPSVQARSHTGHSHSHHHHDNAFLTSQNRKDAGVRITRIGLYVNLGMAIGKGVGGYYFHSQALVADAFHALTDLVSDFMTLATVSWAMKPPSTRFPSGYGKIESLGSLGVSGLLLAGGVLMGLNACEVLYHQLFVDAIASAHSHVGLFGHSHSHSGANTIPNVNAAWLAAGSIVVKEYLYRATMKIAKERKSSVLASNAVHHRIDSLTSVVALIAIGGSHLVHGATWLDPVGGLIVSTMVIRAGWGNTGAALLELADVGVDEDVKNAVRKAATSVSSTQGSLLPTLSSKEATMEIRDVQGIKAGQNYLMSVEVAVPGNMSVRQTREVEVALRQQIARVRGVRKVKVRFVPMEQGVEDFADEFISADVSPRSSPEPDDEMAQEHEHHHHHHHNHTHEHNNYSSTNGDLRKRH